MDFNIKDNRLIRYAGNDAKVTIPSNVKYIDAGAFWECTSLTDVIIPSGVMYIGYSAFSHCRSLTNITIPDSVTGISPTAFNNCPNLTIKCNPGSYAESWAKDHGFKTKSLVSQMRTILEEANRASLTIDSSYISIER